MSWIYIDKILCSADKGKWNKQVYGDNIILENSLLSVLIAASTLKDFDVDNHNIYPSDYRHLEVFITNKFSTINHHEDYLRIWELNKKGIRRIDTYDNPQEITNFEDLLPFLPAQLEIGCGPSIEIGIPALDTLHEIYGVQNKKTLKFYFGNNDNFLVDFFENYENMFEKFSYIIIKILQAELGTSQFCIKQLYDLSVFRGDILSNNFDGVLRRLGINDYCMRTYNYESLYPQVKFADGIKSLIVLGSHADRRKIQEKARELGIKIIYINPEGYFENGVFRTKKVESLKDTDIIVRKCSHEALSELLRIIKDKKISFID